jgi:hypothetical protein
MLGGFQEVEFDFVADNPGLTLFHCHQQLHMDFGFMQLLEYVWAAFVSSSSLGARASTLTQELLVSRMITAAKRSRVLLHDQASSCFSLSGTE